MRKVRHTPEGDPDDFSLSTPDQIVKQFDSVTGLIVMVSIAISGLGLLVGGIGVMNIMLVSVTERTREIGVRKAIGARKVDIVWQFLLEAMALTGVGGGLGILFAILATLLVGALFPSLPPKCPPGLSSPVSASPWPSASSSAPGRHQGRAPGPSRRSPLRISPISAPARALAGRSTRSASAPLLRT